MQALLQLPINQPIFEVNKYKRFLIVWSGLLYTYKGIYRFGA